MPATSTIDPVRRLVTTVCDGPFRLDVILEDMDRIRSHPHFRPQFSQLIDLTNASFEIGPKETVDLSEVRLFDATARRAIVASTDLAYGMARMYATYREIQGEANLMVFRSREEALEWIGETSPAADQRIGNDTPDLF